MFSLSSTLARTSHRVTRQTSAVTVTEASGEFRVGRDLVEEEFAETERVKLSVYLYYAKNVGALMSALSVLFYALFQAKLATDPKKVFTNTRFFMWLLLLYRSTFRSRSQKRSQRSQRKRSRCTVTDPNSLDRRIDHS